MGTFSLIRRHFFLVAALVVLAVMIVAGGLKVLGKKPGQGAGAPAGMAQGMGGGGGMPAGKGGGRGFGGGLGRSGQMNSASQQQRGKRTGCDSHELSLGKDDDG